MVVHPGSDGQAATYLPVESRQIFTYSFIVDTPFCCDALLSVTIVFLTPYIYTLCAKTTLGNSQHFFTYPLPTDAPLKLILQTPPPHTEASYSICCDMFSDRSICTLDYIRRPFLIARDF